MLNFLQLVSLAVYLGQVSAVNVYGQCGGKNYSGDTNCVNSVCTVLNEWYYQCLPGTPATTAAPETTAPGTTAVPDTTAPGTTAAPPTNTASPSADGLNGKFVAKGKKFWGTCADSNTLNIAANVAVLKSDFGQVTPENSMKWESIEPSRGSFSWGGADTLVNWAVQNNKLIRGHTLVWHSQLPGWVSNIGSSSELTTVIQNHIASVAGRYAGKLYGKCLDYASFSWDVVNEMLTEQGGLRDSVFSRVLGESFVAIAFKAARAADPTAVLYINDYNLDSNNAKTQGMVALVKRVNANEKIIDAIGTQMHLSQGGAGGVQAALTALAAAPVDEVAITELDISGGGSNEYTTVTNACLAVPKCVAITSWGVSDTNSWRASTNPLLFDGQYKPKAAYNAVMSVLN